MVCILEAGTHSTTDLTDLDNFRNTNLPMGAMRSSPLQNYWGSQVPTLPSFEIMSKNGSRLVNVWSQPPNSYLTNGAEIKATATSAIKPDRKIETWSELKR